jgi:hypothetical protein
MCGYTEMEPGLPSKRIHKSVVLETANKIRKIYTVKRKGKAIPVTGHGGS